MIIFGKNPVQDLFEKDRSKIKKIWIDSRRHQNFKKELVASSIQIEEFSDFRGPELNQNHQMILAKIEDPEILSLDELISKANGKPLLILDQISDPQNLGAIIRNAVAFEAGGIIMPKFNQAPLTSTAIKASAGTWMDMNIAETSSLNNVLIKLKENGYWIVSTVLGGDKTLKDIEDFDAPLAIIMGNEGKGVRKSLIDKSDLKIEIEMSDKAESLNVSVASALILNSIYKKNK